MACEFKSSSQMEHLGEQAQGIQKVAFTIYIAQ